MLELIKAKGNTYYIDNINNIGICKLNEKEVFVIDTGLNSEMGRRIRDIVARNGWTVKFVINTHSHADHNGGNRFLQEEYNCKIYSSHGEIASSNVPFLNTTMVYGGYPPKSIYGDFYLSEQSEVTDINELTLPCGYEVIKLKGHSIDMIGIKTPDDVYFIADTILSEKSLLRFGISYNYDIKSYLETLDYLKTLNGKLFIPAHAKPYEDIAEIVELNRKKILEIIENILNFIQEKKTFDEILAHLFEIYNLKMDFKQHTMQSCTLKSYLSYLYNDDKIEQIVENNKLYFKRV